MTPALPIYLDYNATTPVAPEVAEAMSFFLREGYGNPSSAHERGHAARAAVDEARHHVAVLIGAVPSSIVFTGCATEANNLAVLGVARAVSPHKRHLVVSAVEHPAVMEPAMHLAESGWDVSIVPVDEHGRVRIHELERALRADTALVSVMHANNEVGTIQPIADIAALTRPRGILLHTDAAQSAGKIPVDVGVLGVDLLTLAGHKFYAPKGIGALYVRKGAPLRPILFGAGQEEGLRPGTENVAGIVGLGIAARLARERLPTTSVNLKDVRDRLHSALAAGVPGLLLNGHLDLRLPNTLHVSFPGVSGRDVLDRAGPWVAASVGSACHSESDAVSGVLAAMGLGAARAAGAVRLSVGVMTTRANVEDAARALVQAWSDLR
jgi:cysteine desulfurase